MNEVEREVANQVLDEADDTLRHLKQMVDRLNAFTAALVIEVADGADHD